MERNPDDDWFDKIMVFLSNHISEITEEWFKLLEWLLVLSAFAFIAKQSSEKIILIISNFSILLLWLYCLIGYQAKFHNWLYSRTSQKEIEEHPSKLHFFKWAPLSILATLIAGIVHSLAIAFSNELVAIVNG